MHVFLQAIVKIECVGCESTLKQWMQTCHNLPTSCTSILIAYPHHIRTDVREEQIEEQCGQSRNRECLGVESDPAPP